MQKKKRSCISEEVAETTTVVRCQNDIDFSLPHILLRDFNQKLFATYIMPHGYVSNDTIHNDLSIPTVKQEISNDIQHTRTIVITGYKKMHWFYNRLISVLVHIK